MPLGKYKAGFTWRSAAKIQAQPCCVLHLTRDALLAGALRLRLSSRIAATTYVMLSPGSMLRVSPICKYLSLLLNDLSPRNLTKANGHAREYYILYASDLQPSMATSNSDAQLQRVATDSNGCDLGTSIPKACVVEECPDDDIEVPFRNTDRSRMESRTGISEPYFIEGPQNFSTKPQQTNNMAYTKNHVIGDAYYHTYNGPIYFAPADGARYSNFQGQGFTFGMDSYVGDAQGKASFASTSKLRLQHVSMKQSSVSHPHIDP